MSGIFVFATGLEHHCLPASASAPRSEGCSQDAVSHTQRSFSCHSSVLRGQFGYICSLLYCQSAPLLAQASRHGSAMDQVASLLCRGLLDQDDHSTSTPPCKPGAEQDLFWDGRGQLEQGDVSIETVWF